VTVKCIHCSVRVDRTDWFCPNCKRSLPRQGVRSRGKVWVPASAALLIGVIAVGVGVSRMRAAVPPGATVSIREVPLVRVTPEVVPPEKEVPVEPVPRKRERVAVTPAPKRPAQPDPEPQMASTPTESSAGGTGAINVSTDQPVRTFVYLNGGTLLGEAPLRNAAIPAGKHTLVFWSPSVNGRSTRKVEVSPGGSVEVEEHVRSQDQFKEETGG
jgi:hypothetical protein